MSTLRANNITARLGTGTVTVPTGNKIVGVDGGSVYAPGMIVQTVTNRYTSAFTTAAVENQLMFSQSITTKLSSSTLLVYLYLKQRVDIAGWCLGFIRVIESNSSTTVMYSGYNGANASGWIHDYTAEKPFYAGTAGSTYNFQVRVGSFSGNTNYWNNPANSADDGYAILRIMEVAA